jgi:hypothetical protein
LGLGLSLVGFRDPFPRTEGAAWRIKANVAVALCPDGGGGWRAVMCCADLPRLLCALHPASLFPLLLSCLLLLCSAPAVFVRFLGRCTGRAGLPQMADTFVTDPTTHFNIGQVRSKFKF